MTRRSTPWVMACFLACSCSITAAVAETYTIKRGDSLSSIAEATLGDGARWRELLRLNPSIKHPDTIQIGQKIRISSRGSASKQSEPAPHIPLEPRSMDWRSVQSIPIESLQLMRNFPLHYRYLTASQLELAPIVQSRSTETFLGQQAFLIDASNWSKTLSTRKQFSIYRHSDVSNGQPGRYNRIGSATVVGQRGQTASFEITSETWPIREGDLLLPMETIQTRQVEPQGYLATTIMSTVGDVIQGSGMSGLLVGIQAGERQGLTQGTVAGLYRNRGYLQPQQPLPDEKIGTLLIFRTYPDFSYALVTQASQVPARGDYVRGR